MNNTWVNSRWLHTTLANNNPLRQCAFAVKVIINSSGGKGVFHVVLNFAGDFEFLNSNIQARDVWRAYSRCGSRGSSPVCGVFRLWTSPCALWWECKSVRPLWKTGWRDLKNFKKEILYDPAIVPLGVYPKEVKSPSQKDIFTPMFIATLFTKAGCGSNLTVHWQGTG